MGSTCSFLESDRESGRSSCTQPLVGWLVGSWLARVWTMPSREEGCESNVDNSMRGESNVVSMTGASQM